MPAATKRSNPIRRRLLHFYRVGIFVFLLLMIREQHSRYMLERQGSIRQPLAKEDVLPFFPEADTLSEWNPGHEEQSVLDAEGKKIGHVIQTSPASDNIYGFSGPTNSMIAFDAKRQILGIKILQSDDTKEHLNEVKHDKAFLEQWNRLTKDDAAILDDIHTVSGATLSSVAISDGITKRLGGTGSTSRFPREIEIAEVTPFLEQAASLRPVEKRPFLLQVLDAENRPVGYVSRTSPHADHMMGYQGPTDLLIVLDPDELIIGLALRDTFDNEPYVKLVTGDEYFFNTFKGFSLQQLPELDIVESGLDVVSGATKTSVTVTEGLIHSALEISKIREPRPPQPLISFRARDIGTALVVIAGLVIALTPLKGNRKLRLAFQAVLIIYLGFINADMLSQALLLGWAKSGIAWKVAPGLVFLSVAAVLAPIITGKQVYCTHLCPFGAAQDWLGKKVPWKIPVKGGIEKALSFLPVLLLLWCLIIAMGHLPVSLVALEPFDAFVFRVAGWATLTIAVAGLISSVFINRSYCRYGCPTGAMLKFLRYQGSAEKFGTRDLVAAGFALVAITMMILQ